MRTSIRQALSVSTLLLALALALLAPDAALAESGAPQWTISAVSSPTNFSPTAKPGEDYYRVLITNTGSAAAGCTEEQREAEEKAGVKPVLCPAGSPAVNPITITDILPPGLSLDLKGAAGENTLSTTSGGNSVAPVYGGENRPADGFNCVLATCTYDSVVIPDQTLELFFPVDVEAAGEVTNVIRVSGGGADSASLSAPTTISEHPAPFEIPTGAASTALSSLQAGAHPDITTLYGFSSVSAEGAMAAEEKNIEYRLPPGVASNFAETPACTAAQFAVENGCPSDTQVGITTVYVQSLEGGTHHDHYLEPVYNLAPEAGELAAIGFTIGDDFFVEGDITLRHVGEAEPYGADVTFHDIDDIVDGVIGGSLTTWGVPADPIHNPLRVPPHTSGETGAARLQLGASDEGVAAVPYFTNPTSCGAQLHSEFRVDSWEEPGRYVTEQMPYGPFIGCDGLTFAPALEAQPSANSAETATGLNVNLEMLQDDESGFGVVTSNLDDAKVVLPAGMTVNPSEGAGLAACSEAQFAYEGETVEPVAGHGCPSESKLGSAHARSPGVPEHEEATGSLYLAKPYENQFNSLLAVYLVLRIPKRGVVVTAAGKVEPNETTGQLTTTFDANPQLPVEDFVFSFHQGATAPLVTPPACGSYKTEGDFTPWSEPLQEHLLGSEFEVSSGVDGGACPSGGTPPFAPQVTAGTNNNAAGAYSPLYVRIERRDGEQEITGFSTRLPAGLTGKLMGVEECSEADVQRAREQSGAQAESEPACPRGSEIGYSISEAGVGDTLAQTPGKIYLGGPFEGAPFSVVAVTSAKVGPFDLGTVVIHFPLDINSETAAVSIPSGPSDQIPHIIKGIVVHLRNIRAYINREDFMINPTSCAPTSLSATVYGSGADSSAPVGNNPVTATDRFQAADCASLKFEPKFQVSTRASDSFNQNGASLTAKVTEPSTPQGTQANIAKFKVELPLALPSRLTTLQKACLASVFETNPAACPAASHIGYAVVHTPILPVPLEGPAVFVSHGGEAFPSLIVVLQGDGVTIDLVGTTHISAAGITSTTFKTVPDEPFSTFELTLPQGKYSALVATTNVCKPTTIKTVKKKVTVKRHGKSVKVTKKVSETVAAPLEMPTEIIGQNGAEIHEKTKIGVTGCPKTHTTKSAKKKAKKGPHGKKK